MYNTSSRQFLSLSASVIVRSTLETEKHQTFTAKKNERAKHSCLTTAISEDEFRQRVGHYIRVPVLWSVTRWQQCIYFCWSSGKGFEKDYTSAPAKFLGT